MNRQQKGHIFKLTLLYYQFWRQKLWIQCNLILRRLRPKKKKEKDELPRLYPFFWPILIFIPWWHTESASSLRTHAECLWLFMFSVYQFFSDSRVLLHYILKRRILLSCTNLLVIRFYMFYTIKYVPTRAVMAGFFLYHVSWNFKMSAIHKKSYIKCMVR